MGIVKYDNGIHYKILRLVASGMTLNDVASNLGLSRATIFKWCKKYPKLAKDIERVIEQSELEVIRRGYNTLALGGQFVEETREYFEDRIDVNGEKIGTVKVTQRTKVILPDSKALAVLASRHKSDYQLIKDNSTDININITKVTEANRAMSYEDKLAILSRDSLQVEYTKIDSESQE